MTKENRTAHEMFPMVESYLGSELTQRDFSAEHKISVYVLNYWLAKYRRKSAETGTFMEIQPVAAATERPLLEVCTRRA